MVRRRTGKISTRLVFFRSFKPISEAWHLSQLMLLFVTQAAMELDSRGLLALLLLSLLLGSASKDGKVMEADGSRCFSGCGTPMISMFFNKSCHVDPKSSRPGFRWPATAFSRKLE